MTIFCPICGEELTVPFNAAWLNCDDCKARWKLNHDAEFVDGMWRNLTTLTRI